MNKPLATTSDWTFESINEYYEVLNKIACEEYGLDCYPNQIEIISSEQMLDAYSSIGMPLFYNHWSFGQEFIKQQHFYKKGYMGLAYEIVINSNPCIAYLMEENTMMMQILVIAHACFGHNAFFKGNYLFKQWTDADGIIDYLAFAKKYITECEERYGFDEVEEVLDACHSLQEYGVNKYKRPPRLSAREEKAREKERNEYIQSQINEIWSTIPITKEKDGEVREETFPPEPFENLLYFVEKNAPHMEPWKREIIRIVRKISQYFYPQRQTKVMNEGFATFWHYTLVNELYDRGYINDGYMKEFLVNHTNVITQLPYDHPGYGGINPYALGFAMFSDIKRISIDPTEEDKRHFDWAGNGDWVGNVKYAMENFKDESFILQYLSPKVIRDFKLFSILDLEKDPKLEVSGIHDDLSFKQVKQALAAQYNIGYQIPDIQVVNVDRWGDRSMKLQHNMVGRRPLNGEETIEVLKHLSYLWGYDIYLDSVDEDDMIRASFKVNEDGTTLDVFLDDDDG
jgi:spore cortex formation protein SpoVR/YcgB (stage V sporulation)